jgi:DnaJ-class molecular chaperone
MHGDYVEPGVSRCDDCDGEGYTFIDPDGYYSRACQTCGESGVINRKSVV